MPYEILLQHVSIVPCLCVFGISHFGLYYLYSSTRWQLYSISRWTAEDGKKLKKHLEIEFEIKMNRQIYWDDIPMFCHFEEYELGIWPMNRTDIIEIDNMAELIAVDNSYEKYLEEM